MSIATGEISRSVVLHNVPWHTYDTMVNELAEHHVRLTYDRGTLEIMSPSPKHERAGHIIGRLIVAMADELGRNVAGFGSTTFRRGDREQGLEPDECYYIRNEAGMRSKDEIDLATDPPPDLAVEIDAASSSVDREAVYAGIGVPELWRYSNGGLTAWSLQSSGEYSMIERSLSFPEIVVSEIAGFVALRGTMSDSKLVDLFLEWVRAQKR